MESGGWSQKGGVGSRFRELEGESVVWRWESGVGDVESGCGVERGELGVWRVGDVKSECGVGRLESKGESVVWRLESGVQSFKSG